MNRACEVKQFVARLRSPLTGDPAFYLHNPLDASGCSTCCAFPVRKADLLPEYRRALRHGWGNTL